MRNMSNARSSDDVCWAGDDMVVCCLVVGEFLRSIHKLLVDNHNCMKLCNHLKENREEVFTNYL